MYQVQKHCAHHEILLIKDNNTSLVKFFMGNNMIYESSCCFSGKITFCKNLFLGVYLGIYSLVLKFITKLKRAIKHAENTVWLLD